MRRMDSVRWIALLALITIACSAQAALAADKVVTDANKGGTIHLKVGETLEARLKANPSTGFMWYIEKESTPLLKLVHQTQADLPDLSSGQPSDQSTPQEAGRPVYQVFKFEAKRPGDGVLLLHYVRSWEKPTPEDEHFDLHVVIE
jgi:inhibitor of cysteine peptidase